MSKLTNFRWTLWKALFLTASLTALVLFVFTQIWFSIVPFSHDLSFTLYLVPLVFFCVLVSGIFFSYRYSKENKQRFDDISAFIRILARGKLSQRMEITSEDEMASIEKSLNDLAIKLETQVTSLQKLADENASLAHKAKNAAVIEERQRLARDLHDAVSQQLFALNMMTSAALRTVSQNPENAILQMKEVSSMAAKAQGEMRALLLHLRPVHLSGEPLHVGMRKLVQELAEKTNIYFETQIDQIETISQGIEDHLFRILQEALSNALRHSQATKIVIQLCVKSDALTMNIHDNGKGFDINHKKQASYGLKTMEERCREIGGVLSITSQENQGTHVDIRIPMKQGEGNHGQET